MDKPEKEIIASVENLVMQEYLKTGKYLFAKEIAKILGMLEERIEKYLCQCMRLHSRQDMYTDPNDTDLVPRIHNLWSWAPSREWLKDEIVFYKSKLGINEDG